MADDLKISGFFDQVKVRYLSEAEITAFDPDLLSFFNVNSPEDLAYALDLAQGEKAGQPRDVAAKQSGTPPGGG